ncbi:hypothetical protein ACIGJO_27325 [Streptomyces sp. NPDC079020]|uniref:hypothetical protein n=1 Tax=Streptomyces sp. NPDC079020 TaxID=3365722 RepID=UPI0037D87ED7
MRMLRRAIWNVRVAGPEDMADLGKKLYDINMKRFRIACDTTVSFDERDGRMNAENVDFRRTRAAFVSGAQQILGNDAGRQLPQPTARCGQRGYMRRHGRGGEAY